MYLYKAHVSKPLWPLPLLQERSMRELEPPERLTGLGGRTWIGGGVNEI